MIIICQNLITNYIFKTLIIILTLSLPVTRICIKYSTVYMGLGHSFISSYLIICFHSHITHYQLCIIIIIPDKTSFCPLQWHDTYESLDSGWSCSVGHNVVFHFITNISPRKLIYTAIACMRNHQRRLWQFCRNCYFYLFLFWNSRWNSLVCVRPMGALNKL